MSRERSALEDRKAELIAKQREIASRALDAEKRGRFGLAHCIRREADTLHAALGEVQRRIDALQRRGES